MKKGTIATVVVVLVLIAGGICYLSIRTPSGGGENIPSEENLPEENIPPEENLPEENIPVGEQVFFVAEQSNTGREMYSGWFADSDGRTIYFGQSPFWREQRLHDNNAMAETFRYGDYLVGRFDTLEDKFLEPLNVGWGEGSVWDVLVHSNGYIYTSTFWGPGVRVSEDGSEVKKLISAGMALNELYEGPDGNIYITRYGPEEEEAKWAKEDWGIVVMSPEGGKLRDIPIDDGNDDVQTVPKSIAVAENGWIWINTDQFETKIIGAGCFISHPTLLVSPEGEIVAKVTRPPPWDPSWTNGEEVMENASKIPWVAPRVWVGDVTYVDVPTIWDPVETMFMSFDPEGRGWFAERTMDDKFQMRITFPDGGMQVIDCGDFNPVNYIQDIKHDGDTTIATSWGDEIYIFTKVGENFDVKTVTIDKDQLQERMDGDDLRNFPDPGEGARILYYTTILSDNGYLYTVIMADTALVFDGEPYYIIICKSPMPP